MVNPIRQKAVEGLKKNDTFSYKRTFTKEETLLFGDLTRDYNPVHYDSPWTDHKGFKDQICHGLLVGSMICEFGGQVGWLASGMKFKFIKPVFFNDTIRCTVTIKKIEKDGRAEAEAIFTNQEEQQICYAFLTGRLPLGPEIKILKQMIKKGDPTNNLSEEKYDENDPPVV